MTEPTAPEFFRLFIAISLPEQVKLGLAEAQEELRRLMPGAQARWTHSEQFHLTLRFLGSVGAERVQPLVSALAAACRPFVALHLRAAGLGTFPEAGRPRVLWAGVREPTGQLLPLQKAVETAAQTFTVEKPEARFSGHVTLARFKELNRAEADALTRARANWASKNFGDWSANDIELFRSELRSTGAVHHKIAAVPFKAGAT